MFERRHYRKIAEVLKACYPEDGASLEVIVWKTIVLKCIEMFKKDNFRFDSIKFKKACGYEE